MKTRKTLTFAASLFVILLFSGCVKEHVTVRHMVEKADFETYIFASDPPWAGQRDIADILDILSPTHRMFAISYRAEGGRHVVLVQSHTYNKKLGPKTTSPEATLVYNSPTGVKVWSGPRDKWLARILLKSSRRVIKDRPSEDRTGYLLETPAGTFPALAINGPLSDEELHALIDSLVAVKEYLRNHWAPAAATDARPTSNVSKATP